MGVSGSGKTTVAKSLAESLSYQFVDADDFHDDSAKNLMSQNIPLTDIQRLPWLDRITTYLLLSFKNERSVVLAYSGLKARHRELFRHLPLMPSFFWLNPSQTSIVSRLKKRSDHFVDENFLASQINDFEQPTEAEKDIVPISSDGTLDQIVDQIKCKLHEIEAQCV